MTPVAVTDDLIRIKTAQGVRRVGLHDVLAAVHSGPLIDLPGMRADQRAPVVTALAIISHLIRRYAHKPPSTPDEWRRELAEQFGPTLILAGGEWDQPQFLQPVLPKNATEPISITEADHLMPATRHALKAVDKATPEETLYALMASTWRQHGGPGHPAGARARLLTVLVGDGVTIGSEVAALSAAYDQIRPAVTGSQTKPKRAMDHMLWYHAWADNQPVAKCPFPFIDCRKIRLVLGSAGYLEAVFVKTSEQRVDTGLGAIDDPHVPVMSSGGPFKLVMKRLWTYIVQHEAVAGSKRVIRPRILDLAPAYSAIRISGVHSETGKTGGYWEAFYRISRGKRMRLGPPAAGDRLSSLSERALGVVSDATRLLYLPMVELHDGRAIDAKPFLQRAQGQLRDLLGPLSLQAVLDLVADDPDGEREQKVLHEMAARGLRQVWADTASTYDPLGRARATLVLEYLIRRDFGDRSMSTHEPGILERRVHAILYEIDSHLTPASRARIRSSASSLPIDAYVAIAAVPAADTDDPSRLQVWEAAVRALAVVHQGGPSIGRALAETEYPETRMSALLSSGGDTLRQLINEVVRWLVARDVKRVTLTDLITLGLADAAGDEQSRLAAGDRIALDFARQMRRSERAA